MSRFRCTAAAMLLAAAYASAQARPESFFIHAFHGKVFGSLDCSVCHVPIAKGSAELKRPGHEQCKACHQEDFENKGRPLVCAQCHSGAASQTDLLPFPRYKGMRAILADFSHVAHKDAKMRIDPASGFRSDCTFCHRVASGGAEAEFPRHTQCAGCHSKAGMKPRLGEAAGESDCRGCHAPEEIENPSPVTERRHIPAHAISGRYGKIQFSHAAHFKLKAAYRMDCTTCHSAIQSSSSLTDLTLPPMLDCVACHDTSKKIAAEFRMSNCRVCHVDAVDGRAPSSHTLGVKPASHTESFRLHHREEASLADAKCFACHQNVTPALEAKEQCVSCHQVMKPASHTSRWKDDIHGKFAGIDRTNCATCHTADYCVRCHNELPRSHQPLPLFKAGAHAQLAMLNQRACMSCHTFENTCSKCHARALVR